MTAIGLDIGGTKIELQAFDDDFALILRARIATPADYDGLIDAIAGLVRDAEAQCGAVPVGLSAAGLINRATGLALTANLAATGKPFPADVAARVGHGVTFVNDCRAMALSEAHLGRGRGAARVLGLVLGTGVGAGFVRDGQIDEGAHGLAGELGHIALPAALVAAHGLPVLRCKCGRTGCYETLLSGPGLARLAHHVTGRTATAPDVVRLRATDAAMAAVWRIWAKMLAELLIAAIYTLDPEVVVLGGGLSQAPGLCDDLARALAAAQMPGMALPRIALAEGGDATGARGAALAAVLATNGGRHVIDPA